MKNSVLMSIMFGMVLVAGMASADANTQKAAAASDDDSFLAYIDPSHSADFDKKMVASNSVVGSGAGGSSTERITLLYDIDPSNRIEVKRGPIVPASSLGKMAPDVLLDEIKKEFTQKYESYANTQGGHRIMYSDAELRQADIRPAYSLVVPR